MEYSNTKKYLIHIRLGECDNNRIREAVPLFIDKIKQLSKGEYILAYSSEDAKTFGVVASIAKPAVVIRAAIDGTGSSSNPDHHDRRFNTMFRGGDKVFVLELGSDISSAGFSKPETWLQRH